MSRASSARDGHWPALPEPLPVAVRDAHCHLDLMPAGDPDGPAAGTPADPDAAPDLDRLRAALGAADAVGVTGAVSVGVDLATSRWQVAAARAFPQVRAAVAIHPNEAARGVDAATLDALAELAGLPEVVAIGETGLDFYRTPPEGRPAQEASFRAHIALATATGKALMIHDRDAHADVLRVLDDAGAPPRVIFHCFSGDVAFARACLERGFVLSFAGTVTFRNATALQEAAAACPPAQMLVETDAPFLTPTPWRGRPNGPYLIPHTVRTLAELGGHDLDTLCHQLVDTAARMFG